MPLDDTGLPIHPLSPDPYCRGLYHSQAAQRLRDAAQRRRLAGDDAAAISAERAAAVEQKNADYEFGMVKAALEFYRKG